MRQLAIAAFLAIIALFGTYYLVTEGLHLSFYTGPPAVQFPQYRPPLPLPSITPGPAYKNEFSAGPTHTPAPKPISGGLDLKKSVPISHVTPIPVAAPVLNAPTPLPAPTYTPVAAPEMPHTPPPITVPGLLVKAPSPSPSPRFPDARLRSATPTPQPNTPNPEPSASDSPSPKP